MYELQISPIHPLIMGHFQSYFWNNLEWTDTSDIHKGRTCDISKLKKATKFWIQSVCAVNPGEGGRGWNHSWSDMLEPGVGHLLGGLANICFHRAAFPQRWQSDIPPKTWKCSVENMKPQLKQCLDVLEEQEEAWPNLRGHPVSAELVFVSPTDFIWSWWIHHDFFRA